LTRRTKHRLERLRSSDERNVIFEPRQKRFQEQIIAVPDVFVLSDVDAEVKPQGPRERMSKIFRRKRCEFTLDTDDII